MTSTGLQGVLRLSKQAYNSCTAVKNDLPDFRNLERTGVEQIFAVDRTGLTMQSFNWQRHFGSQKCLAKLLQCLCG